MQDVKWADRGQVLQLDAPEDTASAVAAAVSRLGSVQLSGVLFSVWIQLRGSSWVEAKEGRFRLRAGDWIALEKDSKPHLQTDRYGVCIGLALNGEAARILGRNGDTPLYTGRGRMPLRSARVAVRLWREMIAAGSANPSRPPAQTLRPLLLHLGGVQESISARLPRCPGRSRSRKRQVFGRLQRARLYLEGNRDRVVRISELAELTSFSSWYFSKTFHALYDESPQEASARMRLEHAADLLRETDLMVGEVAAACGFDNPCSFARAFRARHGTSASRYRSHAKSGPRADSAKTNDVGRKASAAS